MCGVIFVHSKKKPLRKELCHQALNSLDHRGPDYKLNFEEETNLFFGQTVLSITGKPDEKLKVFNHSRSKKYFLLFNGEIYNYQDIKKKYQINELATNTDTEILVNLFEKENLKNIPNVIEGMYAYLCYDKRKRKIYVSRDIIGEKCLYKYETEEILVISSEIKTILEFIEKPKINYYEFYKYFFSRHFLTDKNSFFENISIISPGVTLEYSIDHMQWKTILKKDLSSFIDPNIIENNKFRSKDDLIDELDSLFINNARMLDPGYKFASVFSGGVDSSLSSIYMNSVNNKCEFYALSFGLKDQVAKQLNIFENVINKKISVKEVTNYTFLKAILESYDKTLIPFATHSFVSQNILTKIIKENDLRVLIGGDGADELFGGYEIYKNIDFNDAYYNPSPYSGYVNNHITFSNFDAVRYKEMNREVWEGTKKFFPSDNGSDSVIQRVLYLDTKLQLESVGLRSSDLMSMLNSVESRGFYITSNIIKFAINLPAKYKINLSEENERMKTKPLLKYLFIRKFGEKLLFDKQGFSGFPNESGKIILKNQFNLFESYFDTNPRNYSLKDNQALEWKVINVELFLKTLYEKNIITT